MARAILLAARLLALALLPNGEGGHALCAVFRQRE
jgi:hypothetical protein